jgi:hypothetical protein
MLSSRKGRQGRKEEGKSDMSTVRRAAEKTMIWVNRIAINRTPSNGVTSVLQAFNVV